MIDDTKVVSCFKAYDVRARVPEELNEDIAFRIGCAYAAVIQPKKVVLGYDIRLTSPALVTALAEGLNSQGVNVFNIGLCGTEEIYFATAHFEMDGGIMVTASHNPVEYNGMKFVVAGARPLTRDNGLAEIESRILSGERLPSLGGGTRQDLVARPAYIEHLLTYVDLSALKPLKIVVDPGNGGASLALDALEKQLPFDFIKVNYQPDGSFPNGVPNPLLPENRGAIIQAIKDNDADLGIAWDGDFDRCFLFDESGGFIEGYYIVGLLGVAFLKHHPGEKIVYDPRLSWNTIDVVTEQGGVPILSKTGHAFIKESMRRENAIYGGEMSGHHYFRDFFYCDSGMIPWLLVVEMLSITGKSLSQLIGERMSMFPCSGEINFKVSDTEAAIRAVRGRFEAEALVVNEIDGIGLEFPDWRFNLRGSNTEPVLRLNVESRGDEALMRARTQEISNMLG